MIPEVRALNDKKDVIRIPHQIDVPVTPRVLKLIDSRPFQRLSRIRQLGLVSFVYPGATHSRFEHSLGVYRNALLFIERLSQFDFFRQTFDSAQIEAVVVAALLHDIGHWPYCHPIEDLSLPSVPEHESIAEKLVRSNELLELIESDWLVPVDLIARLIVGQPSNDAERLLASILSGPIDVDKMDYLHRDSLHCGVPYGMQVDAPRLIHSIGINSRQNGIAISSKGKTSAELMVFARYVMFNEVYWHRTVRSATAMLQRLFYNWFQENQRLCDADFLYALDDRNMVLLLESDSELYRGLFGSQRSLYKSLLDYSANQDAQVFNAIAHKPYPRILEIGQKLVRCLADQTGDAVKLDEILIDAPPPGLEVQFQVEVKDETTQASLENLSPVVEALATQQFDHFVKRVRVFIHPRLDDMLDPESVASCLRQIVVND